MRLLAGVGLQQGQDQQHVLLVVGRPARHKHVHTYTSRSVGRSRQLAHGGDKIGSCGWGESSPRSYLPVAVEEDGGQGQVVVVVDNELEVGRRLARHVVRHAVQVWGRRHVAGSRSSSISVPSRWLALYMKETGLCL